MVPRRDGDIPLNYRCAQETFVFIWKTPSSTVLFPISPSQFFPTHRPRGYYAPLSIPDNVLNPYMKPPARGRARLEGLVVCAERLVSYSDYNVFSVISKSSGIQTNKVNQVKQRKASNR
jgi:hypothetical protein